MLHEAKHHALYKANAVPKFFYVPQMQNTDNLAAMTDKPY